MLLYETALKLAATPWLYPEDAFPGNWQLCQNLRGHIVAERRLPEWYPKLVGPRRDLMHFKNTRGNLHGALGTFDQLQKLGMLLNEISDVQSMYRQSFDGDPFFNCMFVHPRLAAFEVADISDSLLTERLQHITPLCRNAKGVLRHIRQASLEALRRESVRALPVKRTQPTSLCEVARIATVHSFTGSMFFHPTAAEVLAQIPEALLSKTRSFEVLLADTRTEFWWATRQQFHVAETVLYG